MGKSTERYSTAEGVDLTITSERHDEDGSDLLDVTVYVNPYRGFELADFTLRGILCQDGAGFRLSYQRDHRTPGEATP